MPLSPEDVVRKTFTTAVLRRGYNEKEVDTFLEEVVAELRRLYERTDELAAQVSNLEARTSSDVVSERVQREQHQVELVRAERRDLVADMAELQARHDQTVRATDEAEQRRDEAARAAIELEERRATLAGQVRQQEERLERVHAEHDEIVAAQDRTAAELRTLRAAADVQAETLGPIETEPTGNAQLDDLATVAAVAHRLHTDHVEEGRAHAEQLRTSAEEETTALRESTQRQSEQLLTDARSMARAEHERLVREGQESHDRLVREAEERRAGVLADLEARSELLEARLASLDAAQRGYRERLRELVQSQLDALDDQGWEPER